MSKWKRNYSVVKIKSLSFNPANWVFLTDFICIESFIIWNYFCLTFFGLLLKEYSCSVESLSEYASKSIPGVFFFKPLCFLLIEKSLYFSKYSFGFMAIVKMFVLLMFSNSYRPTCFFKLLFWTLNCSQKSSDKSSLFKLWI